VRVGFRLWNRNTVSGLHHVPAEGPFIIAANHLSFLDHIAIATYSPRPVYFLGKAERLRERTLTGRLRGMFFRFMHMIPVDRDGGARGRDALLQSELVLAQDVGFAIHVEGTRSPDGRLYKARTGVAWLAMKTGAPVIPCGLTATQVAQPPGARWIRPRPFTAQFGPALDLRDFEGQFDHPRARREVASQVTRAIQQITGQEYVDRYASKGLSLERETADA
jgi:1-acyl-sn-glycerol-3-phosphate acyltransferase